METTVSGFKRKPSERPRSYAICSDSKRAKLEQTEELRQDQTSNIISHVESNFESTVWNQKPEKPETTENNLRNIHFRLENMISN
jgi:hypothetical protein